MFREMRLARERLIMHALAVLEEAVEQSNAGRVEPSAAIRLAQAVLYAFSKPTDGIDPRAWHATFWEQLTGRSEADTRTSSGFGRWQSLNSSLNGMARAAGLPRDHVYDEARAKMRERLIAEEQRRAAADPGAPR